MFIKVDALPLFIIYFPSGFLNVRFRYNDDDDGGDLIEKNASVAAWRHREPNN